MKTCSIADCERKYVAKGYCSTHYAREFYSSVGATGVTIYDTRPAVIDGDTAKIPLGIHGVSYTIVDAEFAHLDRHKWSLDHYGYAVGHVGGKHVKLHQLIIGKKEWHDIDHISRDKLDNRKSNLRHVTHRENTLNTGMFKHNTSGHKGVTWDKSRDKWAAKIQVLGKTINLGRYHDINLAIQARVEAEVKYFNKKEALCQQ